MSYPLFSVFGVELEYMIVDRATLDVRPIADALIHAETGTYASEVERGPVSWSNELVNHVLELKTNGPAPSLAGLAEAFGAEVRYVNRRLAPFGARLLPTGAHPWMDPHREMVLWPHEYNEVYALYNRIFDCRGHGWANLQSAHLNLPFDSDAAFGALHAAVRVLLPVLPALSASTPVLGGRPTGLADSRLEAYRHNQARLPSLTGRVVPEAVFTEADYDARIFAPIRADVRPYDAEGVLEHHFLNSRGAIARFDRGAIEVRVLDLQECPAADLAILHVVVAALQALVAERWQPLDALKAWPEDDLLPILLDAIRHGEAAPIDNADYLRCFGLDVRACTAGELWRHLLTSLGADLPTDVRARLARIVRGGTLATRIARRLGPGPDRAALAAVYGELAEGLDANRMFP